ncbi:MAG: hypothetical protein MSH55_05390 [Enorma sp.]|uniref:hypothetical protein n=1 Tax=Enorma sp. TaxID=1920692 RepID=UPI00258A5B5D|nr:hypothetical protein [Enorma sp.]MCI7775199.1 hypothetical protein [Enorma sp.]
MKHPSPQVSKVSAVVVLVLLACAAGIAVLYCHAAQQADVAVETTGGWTDAMHYSSGTVISCDQEHHTVTVHIDTDSSGFDAGSRPVFSFKDTVDLSWVQAGDRVTVFHWSPYEDPTIPVPARSISQSDE